jgi:hypothetical protein
METTAGKARASSPVEWLQGLLNNRTWQLAGATVAAIVLGLVVVWRVGLFSAGPVVTVPYPTVAVEAAATLDGERYSPGDSVGLRFSFTNRSPDTLLFPLPPAFRIETPDAQAVRSFPRGQTTASLAPEESSSFSLTWDQTDDRGVQVAPGEYLIVMPNVPLGDSGFLSLPESPTIVIVAP